MLPIKSGYDLCIHVDSLFSSMPAAAHLKQPQMTAHQKIHICASRYIAEVGLQDLTPAFNVGVGNCHMAVKATWPYQRLVQSLWKVGCSYADDTFARLEPANISFSHVLQNENQKGLETTWHGSDHDKGQSGERVATLAPDLHGSNS